MEARSSRAIRPDPRVAQACEKEARRRAPVSNFALMQSSLGLHTNRGRATYVTYSEFAADALRPFDSQVLLAGAPSPLWPDHSGPKGGLNTAEEPLSQTREVITMSHNPIEDSQASSEPQISRKRDWRKGLPETVGYAISVTTAILTAMAVVLPNSPFVGRRWLVALCVLVAFAIQFVVANFVARRK